jgi:outer membrane lipoprotein-sorting protein
MNTLDQTLKLLAELEPDEAMVHAAQRKLEATVAARTAKGATSKPTRRVGGWLAAAASAGAVVLAMLWMPLVSTTALAFAQVQQHFRDFRTLRFDVEQSVNGSSVMKSRVHVTHDGNVRTDVGDLVSVIVNSSEGRVLTLHHPAHVATIAPLDAPVTKDDAMAWLEEIREFQGEARALPQTRLIGLHRAHGWELTTAAGKLVLWATDEGLPLEMTLSGSAALELSFDFEFDPAIPAQMFSTEIPEGYSLGKEED